MGRGGERRSEFSVRASGLDVARLFASIADSLRGRFRRAVTTHVAELATYRAGLAEEGGMIKVLRLTIVALLTLSAVSREMTEPAAGIALTPATDTSTATAEAAAAAAKCTSATTSIAARTHRAVSGDMSNLSAFIALGPTRHARATSACASATVAGAFARKVAGLAAVVTGI